MRINKKGKKHRKVFIVTDRALMSNRLRSNDTRYLEPNAFKHISFGLCYVHRIFTIIHVINTNPFRQFFLCFRRSLIRYDTESKFHVFFWMPQLLLLNEIISWERASERLCESKCKSKLERGRKSGKKLVAINSIWNNQMVFIID